MSFVHLHRHSEFSLLDGIGTADQYAQRAAEIGQHALALTDHGTLSGSLHHIKACNEVGILPISGVEAYFKPDRHLQDKEHRENWHQVLLAKNLRGWNNLIKITSEAYASGFYHKPCVDWELLREYSDGLVATSACIGSYLNFCILRGDDHGVADTLKKFLDIYADDFYIELMPHDFDDQKFLNVQLVNVAQEYGIPLIATVDAHYPYKEWAQTQDIALMIKTGQNTNERIEKKQKGDDVYEFDATTLYIMSEQEVRETFFANHPDVPRDTINDCINNTSELVGTFDFYTIDRSPKLPHMEGGEKEAGRVIREWCEEGLERIDKQDDPVYTERFDYEYGVLERKGVLGYIFIIGDMVRWAKLQGIRVGAGRGSAAGCLVSYLSRITAVDPIAHGLLFERFLNPERKGFPDIDIDIQHDRRDEVKAYLGERWGEDHVADIITHQTYGPRSALQDVARVLCVPYKEVMDVTNTIDEKTEDNLQEIIQGNSTLASFAGDYPEVMAHAARLEGQIKAISKHAAGVVVTDEPVFNYMPTMRSKDGGTCTAWSDRAAFPIIEIFGFLKLDLLSTDGLTKQQEALSKVQTRREAQSIIDLDDLPVCRDPYAVEDKVMEGFRRGLNLGVFQFEGRGITNLLRKIKPTFLGDIAAANALYRPGPLQGGIAALYGQIKNGKAPLHYWHPTVEPFMQETYGLMVYQEQVMQIVQMLAGFSAGDADDFRKAMGKLYRLPKNEAQRFMNQYRERWDEGTKRYGIESEVSSDIWEKILAFGGYGFNKSHSVSYGIQAYQDMWIKINYPKEFYSSLLTHEPEKTPSAIREGQIVGVKFLPPDINLSKRGFNIEQNGIRFGLVGIKYVGDAVIAAIDKYRPFESFEDLDARVPKKMCNKRAKEFLLKAGAFDSFGARDGWSLDDMAQGEKEALEFELQISSATEALRKIIDDRIYTEQEVDEANDGEGLTVGGEISHVKRIITKKGDPMAFIDVIHRTNQYSCTIFPNVFGEIEPLLDTKEPILIRGRKDDRGSVIVFAACKAAKLQESLAA